MTPCWLYLTHRNLMLIWYSPQLNEDKSWPRCDQQSESKFAKEHQLTSTYFQELQISVWSICVYLSRRLLLPLLCRVMENIFLKPGLYWMSKRLAPLAHNPFQRPNRNTCYWVFSKHNSKFRRIDKHTNYNVSVSSHLFIFLIHFFKIWVHYVATPCIIFQDKTKLLWLS